MRAIVEPVKKKYVDFSEAKKYLSVSDDLLLKLITEKGLTVMARGQKKRWLLVSELDKMMEGFVIKQGSII